jgi:benzodiazapine receptor
MTFKKLPWWQIILIAVALSAIGGLSSGRRSKDDRRLYEVELKQAPWAPPGWLFGPAWTFNNIFILFALQRILTSNMPQRKKLLILQAFIWAIFFSFGYVYFNRRSPILAAIWTVSDALLAIASFAIAFRPDRKTAYNYIPLICWTSFASTVAVWQAVNNDDPVFE